jgi:dTMP kinase
VGYTRDVSEIARDGRGRFVTLEGPEGAGKSTLAIALRDDLQSLSGGSGRRDGPGPGAAAGSGIRLGPSVVLTREPGGTEMGERIRRLLLGDEGRTAPTLIGDALLFNAARAELVSEVIEPALRRGDTVICARYADSTIAYQGYGAGLPIADLRAIERFATGGLTPDLTILLDLPVEAGLARKTGDDITRFEASFDLAFHRRVRDGFLELARSEPERFVVVDGLGPPRTVFEAARRAIAERFPELVSPGADAWSGTPAERPTGARGPVPSEPGRPSVRTTR